MELAAELELSLARICSAGQAEARENGEWLAALDGFRYEVRLHGVVTLLHLCSARQSLVRRVIGVITASPVGIVMEVAQLGHIRPAQLEIAISNGDRQPWRVGREQFRFRLTQLLADHFPDEVVDSLTTAARLHQSLSGSYPRGLMHRASETFAVIAAAPEENKATIDGILAFGLLWLDANIHRAGRRKIRGLRILLPRGSASTVAHRMAALSASHEIELYEYDEPLGRVRRVALSDTGNMSSWVVPRREIDAALLASRIEVERIERLDPEAIRVEVSASTRDVTLRYRGLEFARWQQGVVFFGVGASQKVLTPENSRELEKLVGQLKVHRHSLATDGKHKLYRAQPERWLETLIAADPSRIDARLHSRYLYTQVPAFSSSNRGIMDLLGVTRDGRLAVLELKAAEDIQLVMQAVDYWLRTRWHHDQDDFHRFGYFPGMELQPQPPLLFLVAPGFRFHPAGEILLRYLSPEIEVIRIGLGENWRRSLKVIFRQ